MSIPISRVLAIMAAGLVGTIVLTHWFTHSRWLAVVWLTEGVLGLAACAWNLHQAQLDLAATGASEGGTGVYSRAVVRRDAIRAFCQVCIIVAGAASFFQIAWAQEAVLVSLLYLPFALGANSAFDMTLRGRMAQAERDYQATLKPQARNRRRKP